MMVNRITIEGNLCNEPELRYTRNGDPMASFRLASESKRKDQNGQWVSVGTLFVNVATYGKVAESVAASLHKGNSAVVTGKLDARNWESNGKSGTSLEITAESVGATLRFQHALLSKPSQGGQQPSGGFGGQAASDPRGSQPTGQMNDEPPF